MRIATGLLWTIAAAAMQFSAFAFADDAAHSLEADEADSHWSAREIREKARERVRWRDLQRNNDPVVHLKILGINDFHGQLSPRAVAGRLAGGAAVLASYLKAAAGSAEDGSLIIHAGDHVGASPPNSALLQDEPAIGFLNLLANDHCRYLRTEGAAANWVRAHLTPRCNIVGTLGNHEFDEGVTELLRLLDGGNSAKGPFLEDPWRGAKFPYVSANVVSADTGRPLLAPYTIKLLDEAAALNQYARELRSRGVRAIVVTIHKGTSQGSFVGQTPQEAQNLSGAVIDIVKQLDDEVDVVISGHTHSFTNALVANNNGKAILVTQAFSASTAYDDIDLAISRKTGDVVEKSAAIVTTWGDEGPGLSPDVKTATMVAAADDRVGPLVNEVVGVATQNITRAENSAGESALGNLIADAQRVTTGTTLSFMNPGGIRADLAAGEVTWGELFTVQPFGNDLVSMDLTGAQIKTLLEQQWQGQPTPRILKTSGLTYTWDASRPVGDRVVQIFDTNSAPLDQAAIYRVTVNSFIAAGGDNFLVLRDGANRVVGPVDLDALVSHVRALAQPFTAAIEGRIQRIN